MGNFSNWVNKKLNKHQRGDLLEDLLKVLSKKTIARVLNWVLDNESKAYVVDELATELNEAGWDWNSTENKQKNNVSDLALDRDYYENNWPWKQID